MEGPRIDLSEQNVDKQMNVEVSFQEFAKIMERDLGFQSSWGGFKSLRNRGSLAFSLIAHERTFLQVLS